MVAEIINGAFQVIDPGRNFPGQFFWQQAIQNSSLELYLTFRGNLLWYKQGLPQTKINFEETTDTTNALEEMYHVFSQPGAPIVKITDLTGTYTIDKPQIVEVQYAVGNPEDGQVGPLRSVVWYNDEQYTLMRDRKYNPVTELNPIGRLRELNTYELYPTPVQVSSRCLVMPDIPAFTFTPSGGPVPNIQVQKDLNWMPDKTTLLIDRVVERLGIQFRNQNLVQGAQLEQSKVL